MCLCVRSCPTEELTRTRVKSSSGDGHLNLLQHKAVLFVHEGIFYSLGCHLSFEEKDFIHS